MSDKPAKHTFYCPPNSFVAGMETGEPERVVFPREEAHHALHVLRVGVGDEVLITDGEGGLFRVEMEVMAKKQAVGRVLERLSPGTDPKVQLRVALGLIKQAARYETFLEKAVELGVSGIVPLESARTERSRLRMDRCQNILVAALKQSGRSWLPALEAAESFASIIKDLEPGEVGLVAHEAGSVANHLRAECEMLREAVGNAADGNAADGTTVDPLRITLLVGPEGGFTDQEVEQARVAGWRPIWLGPRRLRAETAAMAAAGFIIMSLE